MSSQGHIWSTAAYVTNYGEKIVPSGYAGKHADMDGEESDEPERGFLWTLAKREGVSFRDYGGNGQGDSRLARDATRLGRQRESRLRSDGFCYARSEAG